MKKIHHIMTLCGVLIAATCPAQAQQGAKKTKPRSSSKKNIPQEKVVPKAQSVKSRNTPLKLDQKDLSQSVSNSAQDIYVKTVMRVLSELNLSFEKLDSVMEDLDSTDMKNPSSLNPTAELGAWTDEDKKWSAERDARRIAVTTPVRTQLDRLKGITVIPRSMSAIDKKLTQYTLEMSRYLDILDQGSAGYSKPAIQQRDIANRILDGVLKELSIKTDPAVKQKKYVDG